MAEYLNLSFLFSHSFQPMRRNFVSPSADGVCHSNLEKKFFYQCNNLFQFNMPEWRNGRRTGLKIPRWQHHEGSTPSSGTKQE